MRILFLWEYHTLIFFLHFYEKLDEVGFEWTPRGNTRVTWDEGFEILVSVIHEHELSPYQYPSFLLYDANFALHTMFSLSILIVWITLFPVDGVWQNKWTL